MSWQEYNAKNELVADWLPWGGLTEPFVLENKDGSFLGVIEYKPIAEDVKIKIPPMQNGWAFWLEEQHIKNENKKFYLVLCWNPILSKNYIVNTLNGKIIVKEKAREIFKIVLHDFKAKFSAVTDSKLLQYQELIDFLSFTISMGENRVEMPEIPLFLDALLTNNIPWKFGKNDVGIDDKLFIVVSIPASISDEELDFIFREFNYYPIRHVRRLLLFDKKSAKEMMEAYTKAWCRGRKSIKNLMLGDIFNELSGYFTENLILLTNENERSAVQTELSNLLSDLELSFRIEEYNKKDVWWGTLPGVFRANVTPPITGFSNLSELLAHKSNKKIVIGEDNYVSYESV